jgi:phosphatidylserine decarboxylase
VNLGEGRQSTPTIFKTLNPEWNVSFEMPIGGVPLLECICWDHDRFGKDYLGEFDIALEDIFSDGQIKKEVCHFELGELKKQAPS